MARPRATQRPRPAPEGARFAALYPAIAEAARRVGATTIGLVDVGASPGLNLHVDRVGITYSNGQSLGDPLAEVQVSSIVRGDQPIPTRVIPAVAARISVERDPVELLPDAVARVPSDALPVVTTMWALADLPQTSRLRFVQRLEESAKTRPVAWVSVEGVGVAPGVPTLGDRPASGHSIIGVGVFQPTLRVEAVGRCWGRGRWMSWLAES